MTLLAGPAVLVLVVLVLPGSLCAAQDGETLEVNYPQRSVTAAAGSSVTLSCDAVERCGVLRAAWYRLADPGAARPADAPLTDPGRHFTVVNETDDGVRRRQVVTELRGLRAEDGGRFQCKAACEDRDVVMGHYITIAVQADQLAESAPPTKG